MVSTPRTVRASVAPDVHVVRVAVINPSRRCFLSFSNHASSVAIGLQTPCSTGPCQCAACAADGQSRARPSRKAKIIFMSSPLPLSSASPCHRQRAWPPPRRASEPPAQSCPPPPRAHLWPSHALLRRAPWLLSANRGITKPPPISACAPQAALHSGPWSPRPGRLGQRPARRSG